MAWTTRWRALEPKEMGHCLHCGRFDGVLVIGYLFPYYSLRICVFSEYALVEKKSLNDVTVIVYMEYSRAVVYIAIFDGDVEWSDV